MGSQVAEFNNAAQIVRHYNTAPVNTGRVFRTNTVLPDNGIGLTPFGQCTADLRVK
jgi:hypothetical protein